MNNPVRMIALVLLVGLGTGACRPARSGATAGLAGSGASSSSARGASLGATCDACHQNSECASANCNFTNLVSGYCDLAIGDTCTGTDRCSPGACDATGGFCDCPSPGATGGGSGTASTSSASSSGSTGGSSGVDQATGGLPGSSSTMSTMGGTGTGSSAGSTGGSTATGASDLSAASVVTGASGTSSSSSSSSSTSSGTAGSTGVGMSTGGCLPTQRSFASATYPVGVEPSSVALGDFNGDQAPDIAVVNEASRTVGILLNDGTGGFGTENEFPVGDSPTSVAVADFNQDGLPDLAVANFNGGAVTLLLNSGDGGFASQVPLATRPGSAWVTAADLNGDGRMDLATANRYDNSISVLMAEADGGFAPQVVYSVGPEPIFVTTADLAGTGSPALAVANHDGNTVSILSSTLDGGAFASRVDYPVGSSSDPNPDPDSIAIGDLNGDGFPDLAVAAAGRGTTAVAVLFNDGTGGFEPQHLYSSLSGAPLSVAIGDFDGDGLPDVAALCPISGGDAVDLLLNEGDGGLEPQATTYPVGAEPQMLSMGDLNGDGLPDLVVANWGVNTVTVLLGACR